MATETIPTPASGARPTTVTLDAPPIVTPPATGRQRVRNEFPEAYDELESLDAPPRAKAGEPGAAPKEAGAKDMAKESAPERDESGRFLPRPPGAREAEAAPKGESEAAKGEAKATDKSTDGKSAESAPPDAAPDPTAKYQLAHDLRKAFRSLHKEHDALKSEVVTLRARAQAKPDEAAVSEVKQLRQRLSEAEQELRYLDYTKSGEFQEKYSRPYQAAFARAVAEVEEMQVLDESGNPVRSATEQDFRSVMTAGKAEVKALARRLFGEDAGEVLALRRKLNDMNEDANQEAKSYREKAAERERQRTLKAAEEREGLERMWKTKVSEVAEHYKRFFGKVEGDDEYNEALEDGYRRIEAAHAEGLSLEEKTTRLAVVRHKAAAFGAQVLLNKRLTGRVKELEEALKEYERSTPAGGKGGQEERVAAGGAANGKSVEEELDELERRFPGDR